MLNKRNEVCMFYTSTSYEDLVRLSEDHGVQIVTAEVTIMASSIGIRIDNEGNYGCIVWKKDKGFHTYSPDNYSDCEAKLKDLGYSPHLGHEISLTEFRFTEGGRDITCKFLVYEGKGDYVEVCADVRDRYTIRFTKARPVLSLPELKSKVVGWINTIEEM